MISVLILLPFAWHWASKAFDHLKGDVLHVLHEVNGTVMSVVSDIKEGVDKFEGGINVVESTLGKAVEAPKSAIESGAASGIGAAKSRLNGVKSVFHVPPGDWTSHTFVPLLATLTTVVTASETIAKAFATVTALHGLPVWPLWRRNTYNEAYNEVRTAGKTLCDQSSAIGSDGNNVCFKDLYNITTGYCDFVAAGNFPLPPVNETEGKACLAYLDLQRIEIAYCSRSITVVVEHEDEEDEMWKQMVKMREAFCNVASAHGRNTTVNAMKVKGNCGLDSF